MDNYSKVLTFFMENGVQLTNEQLEALKEEFLDEASNDQKEYMKRKLDPTIYNSLSKDPYRDLYDLNDLSTYYPKNREKNKSFLGDYRNGILGSRDRYNDRDIVKKGRDGFNNAKTLKKQDKVIEKTADKLFKEKEAYRENERRNKR